MKCSIRLTKVGNVIETIKLVRNMTAWPLSTCKTFVEAAQKDYQTFYAPNFDTERIIVEAFNNIGTQVHMNYILSVDSDSNGCAKKHITITDLRDTTHSKSVLIGHITSGTFFTGNMNGRTSELYVKCGDVVMCVNTGVLRSCNYVDNYQPVRMELIIKENL